jgi:hypothetical protein
MLLGSFDIAPAPVSATRERDKWTMMTPESHELMFRGPVTNIQGPRECTEQVFENVPFWAVPIPFSDPFLSSIPEKLEIHHFFGLFTAEKQMFHHPGVLKFLHVGGSQRREVCVNA